MSVRGPVRALSTACAAAQAGAVVLWLVAALWQVDGYSVLEHTISDMYALDAPHGAWVALALTVSGAVTMAYALVVLPRALAPAGRWGRATSVLLALSILGLGDALSFLEREPCQLATPGCTTADQAHGGGLVDATLSSVGLLLLVVLGFVAAVAFRRTPGWEAWRWPARAFGVGVAVLLVVNGAATAADLGGLAERVLAASTSAGLVLLALRTRNEPRDPDSP